MLLIDVVVDVLVHWLAGVLEMVVIDVLGDAVPHEGVREHLGDVGEAGEPVVGTVVAANDPSGPPTLP